MCHTIKATVKGEMYYYDSDSRMFENGQSVYYYCDYLFGYKVITLSGQSIISGVVQHRYTNIRFKHGCCEIVDSFSRRQAIDCELAVAYSNGPGTMRISRAVDAGIHVSPFTWSDGQIQEVKHCYKSPDYVVPVMIDEKDILFFDGEILSAQRIRIPCTETLVPQNVMRALPGCKEALRELGELYDHATAQKAEQDALVFKADT